MLLYSIVHPNFLNNRLINDVYSNIVRSPQGVGLLKMTLEVLGDGGA